MSYRIEVKESYEDSFVEYSLYAIDSERELSPNEIAWSFVWGYELFGDQTPSRCECVIRKDGKTVRRFVFFVKGLKINGRFSALAWRKKGDKLVLLDLPKRVPFADWRCIKTVDKEKKP